MNDINVGISSEVLSLRIKLSSGRYIKHILVKAGYNNCRGYRFLQPVSPSSDTSRDWPVCFKDFLPTNGHMAEAQLEIDEFCFWLFLAFEINETKVCSASDGAQRMWAVDGPGMKRLQSVLSLGEWCWWVMDEAWPHRISANLASPRTQAFSFPASHFSQWRKKFHLWATLETGPYFRVRLRVKYSI